MKLKMELFPDAESVVEHSDRLVTLLQRISQRDYDTIEELTEGERIVRLGHELFNKIGFMLFPDTRRGPEIGIRTSSYIHPEIRGTLRLEERYNSTTRERKEQCTGLELSFSYKMPNGEREIEKSDLPPGYVRDNSLHLNEFIETIGVMPTDIEVQFPSYTATIYFSQFKGDRTNSREIRGYIITATVEGIEMNKKKELERIKAYYYAKSPQKEEAIQQVEERIDNVKGVVRSTEYQITAINYYQRGLDFTRGIMYSPGAEMGRNRISNVLKLRLRAFSPEVLNFLPKLLRLYLTPYNKETP